MIETRQIGQTPVHVTAQSFGTASIGNLFQEVSDEAAQATIATAWDAGIRYFDTAPHYGRGLAETRLGHFLRKQPRESYVLSTKVGRVLSPGTQVAEADSYINPAPNDVRYDYSGAGFEASLASSRDRLGTDYIDIVYVHDIGTYTHGDGNAAHMNDFWDTGYERLVTLKKQGKIGAIGLGVNEIAVCQTILNEVPLDVILLAGRYTLLDRSAKVDLLALCQAKGTSLVLGGVFNSGILATGAIENATYDYAPASQAIKAKVNALDKTAHDLGIPLATAALAFAMRAPQTASVLIGTADARTLQRNITAIREPMPVGFDAAFELE